MKFEESDEIKRRPVLIINPQKVFVMALKMTSTDCGDNMAEYRVRDWQCAGLSNSTSIRLRQRLKLEDADIIKRIGRLSPMDIFLIQQRL